jgi:hypothetical protein
MACARAAGSRADGIDKAVPSTAPTSPPRSASGPLADEQVERAGTAVYDLDLGLGLNGSESERFALAALAAIFGGDA